MSAAVARPRAHRAEEFELFFINEDGTARLNQGQAPINLADALETSAALYLKGERVMIRHTDTAGAVTLRFYLIRATAPKWMTVGGQTVRVARRYADHLFDLKPTEKFL
ncbi:hypothetical protein GVO57_11050 [Sphingomonas changnyeongensis]|uniref:Uncharacterized protein n=1 Tax=Sphingomonas changnyeongensis TaxID=2698679 RepID=A0A7Z2NXW2_9SPHN|nr:hypothetical protein [Sphingomonas changnyeongensis]QHL91249.1 hypothetical protein GVO57_11050 [Sphingomonas changnyeongensis]